jgi:hypothetical protein
MNSRPLELWHNDENGNVFRICCIQRCYHPYCHRRLMASSSRILIFSITDSLGVFLTAIQCRFTTTRRASPSSELSQPYLRKFYEFALSSRFLPAWCGFVTFQQVTPLMMWRIRIAVYIVTVIVMALAQHHHEICRRETT